MSFTSPLYLLFFVPFAGLIVYLLIGRRNVVTVPFVELWQGAKGAPRNKRSLSLPPRAIALALLSLLLGILAAARPLICHPMQRHQVVVVVDNGATMIPEGRLQGVYREAGEYLWSQFGFCDITLVYAVGNDIGRTDSSDIGGGSAVAQTFPVDTQEALRTKIGQQLQLQNAPIIVLSDRRLGISNSRVFQITPTATVSNVGIVDVAIREFPVGQLMLRVRNDSPLLEAEAEILTGQLDIQQKITLPALGDVKDYFFDLAEVGPETKVILNAPDEFKFDNTASLIRTGANPRLEIRGDVEPAVRRMIEVYSKNRPPVETSDRVIVCDSLFQMPPQRAVAVASGNSNMAPIRGTIRVEMGHPILREIDFQSLDRATSAGTSPGDGWTSIVQSNDQVLLAVREKPARQVWVGFNSPNFESTRDFVILWSNILDYVGDGGAKIGYDRVAALSSGALPPTLPGIYQKPDGSHVAMNLVDVGFERDPQSLTHLPTTLPVSAGSEGFHLSSLLTLAAALCVLASVLLLRASS